MYFDFQIFWEFILKKLKIFCCLSENYILALKKRYTL